MQRWAEYQYQARMRRSVRFAAVERFGRVPREVSALIEEEGAHAECLAEVSAAAAPVALRRARPVAPGRLCMPAFSGRRITERFKRCMLVTHWRWSTPLLGRCLSV